MTFKVKSVVTPEQLLQMKAMTKAVKALHGIDITRSRGTINEESNVKFVEDKRRVFLNEMGVKRVIPLKPTKRRNYAHA